MHIRTTVKAPTPYIHTAPAMQPFATIDFTDATGATVSLELHELHELANLAAACTMGVQLLAKALAEPPPLEEDAPPPPLAVNLGATLEELRAQLGGTA